MLDFFRNLLSTDGFVALRTCGDWSDGHALLHTVSDLMIWLAYCSIPLLFAFFLWRRRGAVPFPGLVALFAGFILLCGFTHLLDALMFVWPAYRLGGLVKGATAVVSWLTVIALVPAVPRLLALVDAVGGRPTGWRAPDDPGRPQRYVAAAGLAGLALLARFALDRVLNEGQGLVLPLLAVIAAAWYGGFRPGLLALALGGGGFAVLFLEPRGSVQATGLGEEMNLALFVFCGVAASALGHAQRAARAAAEAATADLHESNRHLARSQWATTEALTQLDAFLAHAPVGLAFFDNDLRYVRVNRYLADANRQPADKHVGRTLAEVLPDFPAAVADGFRRVLDTGEPIRDLAVEGTTGPDSVWRVSAYPARDPHGVTVGLAVVAQDVTERTRQGRALAESEARFRTLVEAVPGYVWSAAPDGALDYQSRRVHDYAGTTGDALNGAGWLGIVHPDDVPETVGRWSRSVAAGEPYRHEFRLRRHDGEYRWHDVQALPQRDPAGGVAKWYGYCADVHDQRQAAEALAASQRRFRETADAAPAVLWQTDPDGRCTFLSRGWTELTGQPEADGLGFGWLEMTHPDDAGPSGEAFRRANDTRTVFRVDYRLRQADGSYRWATDEGRPRFGPGGEYLGMVGSVLDIDDRKRAEEAVRASEEQFRAIATQTTVGITLTDLTGRFVYANDRYCELLGYAREELLGRTMQSVTHPDDLAGNLPLFERAVGGGVPFAIEKRYVRKDGGMVWVSNSVSAVRDAAGRPVRVQAVAVDVTARKRAEEEVRQAGDRLRQITDTVPAFIALVGPDGRYQLVNRAYEEQFGKPREELVGRHVREVLGEAGWAAAEPLLARALAGETVGYENDLSAGGSARSLIVTYTPKRGPDGGVRGVVVSAVDVTARKAAEAAVRESEGRLRLALAAGRLGSWELNPLTGTLTCSAECQSHYGFPADHAMTYAELRDSVHPDDRERMRAAVAAALAGGGDYQIEYRNVWPDGSVHWVYVRGQVLAPDRMIGVSLDVTDRKAAEEAVRAGEERYRTLFEAMDQGYCIIELLDGPAGEPDHDWRFVEVNPAFARQNGLHGATGRTIRELAPDIEGHWFERYGAVARTGAASRFVEHSAALGRWFDLYAFRVGGPGSRRVAVLFSDITARKAADQALQEANDELERRVADRTAELRREKAFLAAVLESIEDAIVACDADGTLTLFNRATKRLHGLPAEPLPADRWAEHYSLFGPDGATPLGRDQVPLFRALAGEDVRGAEMVVAPHGAEPRTLLASGRGLFDDDGRRLGAVVSMHDVTDRRAAEAARAELVREQTRRQEEERFRNLADAMPQIVYVSRTDGAVEYLNRGWYDYTGQPAGSADTAGPVHPDDLPALAAGFAAAQAAGTAFAGEFRLRRHDGAYRWFLTRTVPVRDAAGAVAHWYGTSTDIDDQRRAAEAVRAAEEKVRTALEAAGAGSFAWDLDTGRLEFNRPSAALFELPEETTGADALARIHPDDAPRVEQAIRAARAGTARYEIEFRLRTPAGGERWVIGRGDVTRDAAGTPVRMSGVNLDITARKRAEAELAAVTAEADRRRRLYEAFLGSTPDLAYVFDLGHRFTFANDTLLRMWGKSWDEAIGRNCLELGYEPWHAAMHDREIEAVKATKQPVRGEVPFAGTFGRRIYDYIFVPVLGPDGEVEAVAGTTRDVTERKEAEARLAASEADLREAQRVARVGNWRWDAAADVVTGSDELFRIYGLDPAQPFPPRAEQDGTLYPHDAWVRIGHALEHTLATGEPSGVDVPALRGRTEPIWVSVRLEAERDADGRVATLRGTVQDITDRKGAEAERERLLAQVEAERRLLDAVLDALPVGVIIAEPSGKVVRINRANADLWGEAPATGSLDQYGEWVGYWPDTGRRVAGHEWAMARALTTGEHVPGELVEIERFGGGGRRLMINTGNPVRDAAGAVVAGVIAQLDVTDRVRAERALRESEERLQLAVAIAQMGTFDIDLATDAVEVNEPGRAIYGWGTTRTTFARVQDHFHPADKPEVLRRVQAALDPAGPGEFEVEQRVARTDGAERWLRVRGRAAFAGDGADRRAVRLVGAYLDVTDQRAAEAAIRESEANARLALDVAQLGTWRWWPADGRVESDARGRAILGWPADGLTLEQISPTIHPDDLELVEAARRRSLDPAGDGLYAVEHRMVHPDGSVRWVAGRGQTEFAAGGPVLVRGTVADITERKAAEEALRASEEQRRLALDGADLGTFNMDAATGRLTVDERFRAVFGTAGATDYDKAIGCVHPDDQPGVAAAVAAATRPVDPVPYAVEYRVIHPDGAVRWVSAKGRTSFAGDGPGRRPVSFDGTVADVTDRKRAEAALRESEANARLALGVARLGTWRYFPAEERLEADARSRELSAYRPDGALSLADAVARIHPDDLTGVTADLERALAPGGGVYEREHRAVLPDGATRWLLSRGVVEFGPDGRPLVLRGTVLDLSDSRRAERRQRLLADLAAETLGLSDPAAVLAAGVRLLADHLGADRCVYADADPAAGTVTITWEHGDGVPSVAGTHRLGDFGPGAAGMFDADAPYLIEDTEADPALAGHHRAAFRAIAVRAMVNVPVRVGGRLAAILAVHTAAPRAWTPGEVELVRQVAARLWESVERVKAARALAESEANARLALDVGGLGTWRWEPPADRWEADPRTRAVFGLPADGPVAFADLAPRMAPAEFGRVAAALRAAVDPAGTGDYAVDFRFTGPDGSARWAAGRGKVEFRDGAAVLLRGTAQDITDRKRAEERQRLLGDLAAEAQRLADPDAVANAAARLLAEHLGADRCVYAEVEADGRHHTVAGEHQRPGVGSIRGRYRLDDYGDEFVRRMDGGQAFVLPDADADSRLAPDLLGAYRALGVRAGVVVPLHKGGRLASLFAVHLGVPRRWTADEVELVREVAARCWESIERAKVARELAASEARFRGLADTAPQIIWEADLQGRTTFLSRYREEYTGRPFDPAKPAEWQQVIRPDQAARVAANWADAVAGADRYEDLYPIRRADGAYRWFQSRGRLVRRPDGTPDRWVGTSTDIHDRVQAEEALAGTQRTLTMSLAAANAGAYTWDLAADRLTVRTADPASPGTLATSRPVTYEQWLARVHPDDRERVRAEVRAARDGRHPFTLQFRAGSPDAGWRWVENRGQFEYAPDGGPLRLVGVRLDVHDRVAAEEAARKADLEFRALADSIPQLAWMTRPDGHIDWYNSRWYEYTGTTFDEMQGWGWQAVHDPAELDRVATKFRHHIATGVPWEDTFPLRRFDGEFRWFLSRARPIRDDAGNIVRWFGTNTDVTAQRQLEADLRAAGERYRFLDALGQATRETDARATLAVTARQLGGHLRATRCAYADVFADGDRFAIRHDWTDGAASTVGEYSLALFGPQAVADLTGGRPLVVRDVDAELGPAGGADMFNAIGIKAIVCCPLIKGGRLAALMAVHQSTPRDWTPAEVGLVAEVVERSWAHVERARAEDDAREAADRFRTLAESVPALVWSGPADGPADYHSSRWEEYTGRTQADLGGGGWLGSVHPDDRVGAAAAWDAARPDGRPFGVEYRLRRHDGAYRWQLAQALPQRDYAGRVVRWYGTVTDIDDQKGLEHELRQKTAILDTINHHTPTLIYVKDRHGRAVAYNPPTLAAIGRTAEQVVGRTDADWLPAEAAAAFMATDRRVMESGEVAVVEERPDPAADRTFLSIKSPHRGPDGAVVGLIGVSIDITAQKRLEREARAASDRFRTLTEAIPQMVWNADADGRVSYVNTRWREYTGQGEGAAAVDWWEQIAHPADAQGVAEAWAKVALYQRAEPVKTELRVRRAADGAYRWFSMGVVPLTRPDGSIDQWIGSLSDVHDLKSAEEAVRASEARFRHLLDAMPNLVWVTDADGRVVQLNKYWATYTGRPLAELAGDGWADLLHPADAAGAVDGWRAAVQARTAYAAEFRFRVADGSHRWQLARGTPVPGPDGRLSQWFGTTTDIDDRRRAADLLEVQVKERTAELARSNGELEKFAYVASHDLQEPLRKVQAFGDRLAGKFAGPLGPAGKDYIDRMQASAARMQTLINDLLAFSRVNSKAKPFAAVPLGPLVDGVLSDLEALTTRTGATVTVGDLPTVHGDPGQLRQLFQNLIANACKFHKPGRPPAVTLLAERLDALPPAADPPPGLPRGWRVSVCDDGIGFEQHYADRIFEVFQRLHGRGQYEGTGIGLAICRKIAERHGGIITARGRPGEGATFAVDLPDPPEDQRA